MRRLFTAILLTLITSAYATALSPGAVDRAVVISDNASATLVHFDLTDIAKSAVDLDGTEFQTFDITDEGFTQDAGMPKLPAVSRYIILPPDKSVELVVKSAKVRHSKAEKPPSFQDKSELDATINADYYTSGGVYPTQPAVLQSPFCVRQVRMAMVTVYPVRYDPSDGSYVYTDEIDVELRYGNDPPINPARVNFERLPSPDFQRLIEGIALNPAPHRDDRQLVEARGYNDYYLFVLPGNIAERFLEDFNPLLYRLMEWKRRSGNIVELLYIENPRQSSNTEEAIRDRYEELLDQGIEPFDHILIIGEDETNPYNGNASQQGMDFLIPAPTSQFATNPWVDHYDIAWAFLEGNDVFPDLSVNRFHTGNLAMLACGVNKTISYESAPWMEDTDWFTEAVVEEQAINGADDGMTRTVDYFVEALEQNGFDVVAQWRRANQGGDPGPWLADQVNDGIGMIAGRAKNYNLNYVWGHQPQNMFEVVGMYPIAILNSGHGEWAMESMFWVGREWYTRADRYNSLEGAKGAVATTCTWSRPLTTQNNALGVATVHAVLDMQLQMGWARAFTALSFNRAFPGDMNQVIKYTEDHTMCGDPGIRYWRGVPRLINVEHPEILELGNNYIPVTVTDADDDDPVADIMVTLHSGSFDDGMALFQIAYTDAEGRCEFFIDPDIEPPIQITALEKDIYPYLGEIEIEQAAAFVRADIETLDDAEGGNNNGIVNPGETILLTLAATNFGTNEAAENVIVRVSSANPFVQIEENELHFGDIAAEDVAIAEDAVTISIASNCPDSENIALTVTAEADNGEWQSAILLDPQATNIEVASIDGGRIIPQEMTNLAVNLRNIGRLPSGRFNARLLSGGWEIGVVTAVAQYNNIAPEGIGAPIGDGFTISGNVMAIPGQLVPMSIVIEVGGVAIDSASFLLQVSEPRAGTPQGPDGYGYICFDDSDEEFDIAPEYDWVEISRDDRDRDLDGDEVDIDHGTQSNGWGVVDLPFDFQYYGEDFDRITVCTNGFICMGEDDDFVPNYQNWPMDEGGYGGGYGKIAPLWDDLTIPNDGGIYTAYDEEFNIFIIEWYNVHYSGANADQKFQIMLYDPAVWVNATGDGMIKIQYATVSLVRGTLPFYCSIGISSPGNTTGINYGSMGQYPETSAELQNQRALLFTTAPRNITGRVLGQVTNFETGAPIEGAVVYTGLGQVALTDENGNWELPEALAMEFTLTASKPGYNDSTRVYDLGEDEEINADFALLHPEFVLSVNDLEWTLNEGEQHQIEFNLTNTGNGPLAWSVQKELRGDANSDPWDLRRQYPATEITGDSRCQGVAFANDNFYVTGYNGGDKMIWVINHEGQLVDEFAQVAESHYGMKDLTWDGEWFWGSGEDDVIAFNPAGEEMARFDGPWSPNTLVVWDTDRQWLWVSSTTSDIVAYDREGNRQTSLSRQRLRMYGISYYPQDADGCPLYIFHKEEDVGDMVVSKMNPDSDELMQVAIFDDIVSGQPGGTNITNEFDVYSWVYIACTNVGANDRIDIWQIDARRDWFEITPSTGVVNPAERRDFTVDLDATGLPPVNFIADFHFTHNATGGQFRLPVTLHVLGDPNQPVQRELDLSAGWNMISLNVVPENLDILDLMAPLVNEGVLLILKDGRARFYAPEHDFNNIPGWATAEGYQINLSNDFLWQVEGLIIDPETPIALSDGWNLTAYYPNEPIDAVVALENLGDQLVIAKNELGQFYLPEFGFSNMGDMLPGKGYQLRVNGDIELVYNVNGGQAAMAASADISATPHHFSTVSPTGFNMSLLTLANKSDTGAEIGIFSESGMMVGSGVVDATGRCGIAVCGNNILTDIVEGALPGEALSVMVWDSVSERQVTMESVNTSDDLSYQTDAIFIGKLGDAVQPLEFGLANAYPNPFNSMTRVSYSLPSAERVKLAVFDVSGREVTRLVDGEINAGVYSVSWQAVEVSSGVYFIRLSSSSQTSSVKVILMR